MSQSQFAKVMRTSVRLTAAFLHAFGEDVLEHPNGNPVRFRILAAVRGAF